MKKFFKILATIILVPLAIILALQGVTAIYDFPTSSPFEGKYIYNPYQGIDSAQFSRDFKKANFHAHQSMAFGNMDFPEYTYDEFMTAYKDAGYDIITISDHQYRHDGSMLPVYEHGYSLTNFHTQCYGAPSVSWLEHTVMAFPAHQSQYFISTLSDLPLVGVNHPSRLRVGTTADILHTLRGYNVIEMDCTGGGPWDNALSGGNYVTLTCNDDAHSFDSITHRFQNRYNMVDVGADLSLPNVVAALKSGRNYGVQLRGGVSPRGAGTEPRLVKVDVDNDTVVMELASVADSILLIGQGGVVAHRISASDSVRYVFRPQDSYIRAEIHYPAGVVVWLNPFVRTVGAGLQPAALPIAPVNVLLTVLNSVLWAVAALVLLWFIIRMWRGSKRHRLHQRQNLYAPLQYVK